MAACERMQRDVAYVKQPCVCVCVWGGGVRKRAAEMESRVQLLNCVLLWCGAGTLQRGEKQSLGHNPRTWCRFTTLDTVGLEPH